MTNYKRESGNPSPKGKLSTEMGKNGTFRGIKIPATPLLIEYICVLHLS
jgi:hypothetical protein